MLNQQTRRRLRRFASAWGFDGRTTMQALRSFRTVEADYRELQRQRARSPWAGSFAEGVRYNQYVDRYSEAGTASGHYFHQDLLVAREVFHRAPRRHIDVGSSLYGLVSHLASFREVEVLDVRPVRSIVPGITFVQGDIMNVDTEILGSADSVSCLHALEHFGLGRYGDPIDFDGWHKGLLALHRLVAPGGTLYLSVPTSGMPRIEFNAHRVFSVPLLLDALAPLFTVDQLAIVDDAGDLHTDVAPTSPEGQTAYGSSYGCSIWFLRRPPA